MEFVLVVFNGPATPRIAKSSRCCHEWSGPDRSGNRKRYLRNNWIEFFFFFNSFTVRREEKLKTNQSASVEGQATDRGWYIWRFQAEEDICQRYFAGSHSSAFSILMSQAIYVFWLM